MKEKRTDSYSLLNNDCFTQNNSIGVATLVNVTSKDPKIVFVNLGFTQLTGYTTEDINTLLNGSFSNIIHKDQREAIICKFNNHFSENSSYQFIYKIQNKSRSIAWVIDNGYFFTNNNGEKCSTIILTDITGIKVEQHELLNRQERLLLGLKSSKTCMFEVDLTRQLYTFFENAEDIFGVSGQEILDDVQPFSLLEPSDYLIAASNYFSHPDDAEVIAAAFDSINNGIPTTYEARMKAGNTNFTWCKLDVTPILENNTPVRMIGVITNINNTIIKSREFKNQAQKDIFTQLYNKHYTEMLIRKVIDNAINRKHAMILIDLDNFKSLNDTYGHNIGDEVLKNVSRKLRTTFRKTDIVGRFGGDEFMVFMNDISDETNVISRIEKLLEIDNDYNCTKSIGVSFFPNDGNDFETLYKNADLALYQSKRVKNNYTLFKNSVYQEFRGNP